MKCVTAHLPALALLALTPMHGAVLQSINRSFFPGASNSTVAVSNESFTGDASINDMGDGTFELDWTASISFDLDATCTLNNPVNTCTEDFAETRGLGEDPFSFIHHGTITYNFLVPLFVPGTGGLKLGPKISDNYSADTGSGAPRPGVAVSTFAALILPAVIPRGVDFDGLLTVRVTVAMAVDHESFTGSRQVEQQLLNAATPEPQSAALLLSGLGLLTLISRCQRQRQSSQL